MKQILFAVDGTKSSRETAKKMVDIFGCRSHEKITLVHVEKMEGKSLMDDLLLSESEIATLRESLQGTEIQEKLDRKAQRVLEYHQNFLKENDINDVSIMKKEGHPAEEILAASKELGAELIIIGSRSERLHNLFLGSVSREVVNKADCSVLVLR